MSSSSQDGSPKQAEATAFPLDMNGVLHEAPSVRIMAMRSPLASVTETLILTPSSCILLLAPLIIVSASCKVIVGMIFPYCDPPS